MTDHDTETEHESTEANEESESGDGGSGLRKHVSSGTASYALGGLLLLRSDRSARSSNSPPSA